MKKLVLLISVLSALVLFVSCSGGSAPPVITSHSVTLNWTANRESGVNKAGGGYRVSISSQPTFTVPYTEPTSTTVVLKTGTYTVTVQAFAELDAQGGTTGSISAPSTITVHVP